MVLAIIIDLILVALVVTGGIIGVKRGFLLTVAKPIKPFASLAVAVGLSSTVATNIIQPIIQAPITNQISSFLLKKCSNITAATANKKLPTLLKLAAGMTGIDITKLEGDTAAEYIDNLVNKLASPAIHLIAVIISVVLLYFIAKLLFTIILAIVNSIIDHGALGVANKVLGCIFNTLFAFTIAWALTAIFSYVISLPVFAGAEWVKEFDGGFVYRFFKSFTPIDLLLSF